MYGVYPDPASPDPENPEYLPELGTSHLIAGLDWVAAHAGEIDAVETVATCARLDVAPELDTACDDTVVNEAVTNLTDIGVVVVVAGGNGHGPTGGYDASVSTPQSSPDSVTVSNVADFDGKPGGEAEPRTNCGEKSHPEPYEQTDDQLDFDSAHGLVVDIAAPTQCGGTSGASAEVAGAAAALASQCPADNRAGVEFIVDTLMAEGDTAEISEGGWEDDSGDGWKEPLLNLSNEEVFDPVMESTKTHELNHEPDSDCQWLSHQAASDVGSDGRADLVALNPEGGGSVFAGTYEGPEDDPAKQGYEATNPATSLKGQIDPALKDGKGAYAIDAADVNGDRHADLVTFEGGGGGAHVYPGDAEGHFGSPVVSLKGQTLSFDGSGGLLEPIAVADVNGDERGDLVGMRGVKIVVYPGEKDGTFGSYVDAGLANFDSALMDGIGQYFLGAADVNGDGRADMIGMKTSDGTIRVFRGRSDYKFETSLLAAGANPIMDDGKGVEPVGLGDVNRDRRADLLVLDGETLKLYKAKADGTFEEPVVAYEGKVDSSLLDGKGSELIGLQDYSRDGLADLVALNEEGKLLTYNAQRNFTFAAPQVSEGTIHSVRQGGGYEFIAERPFLKRPGCTSTGCVWQPPAHAPRIDAEAYPATLKGSGLNAFGVNGGSFECGESSLQGTATAPTSSPSLSAEAGKCAFLGLSSTLTMNSCHYVLGIKNAAPPYKGTLAVACEKEGEGVEYKAFTAKGALACKAKILPQSGLEGIGLSNTGTGTERGIAYEAEAKGVKYEFSKSCAKETETRTDGVLKGKATLLGTGEAAQKLGVYLTGVGS